MKTYVININNQEVFSTDVSYLSNEDIVAYIELLVGDKVSCCIGDNKENVAIFDYKAMHNKQIVAASLDYNRFLAIPYEDGFDPKDIPMVSRLGVFNKTIKRKIPRIVEEMFYI
jgi:hypothetical protein